MASWDAGGLFDRLSDPTCDYAVHATDDVLLISSRRKSAGIGYTALCAFFTRPDAAVAVSGVSNLVAVACRFGSARSSSTPAPTQPCQTCPAFPCPPNRAWPSLVQLRDVKTDAETVRLDRFQLIDSDFA
jgi:hypothetical protein